MTTPSLTTEHDDRPVTCGAAPATILPAWVAPTNPETWGSTEIAMIAGKRPDQVARELEGQV